MTAEELIERLKTLPPETPVLVEGYETGFDDIVEIRQRQAVRYRQAQEGDGEYQSADKFSGEQKIVSAAVIYGRRGAFRP